MISIPKSNYFLFFIYSLEALRTEEDLTGEAMLSRDDRADSGLGPGSPDELGLDGLRCSSYMTWIFKPFFTILNFA